MKVMVESLGYMNLSHERASTMCSTVVSPTPLSDRVSRGVTKEHQTQEERMRPRRSKYIGQILAYIRTEICTSCAYKSSITR